MKKKSQTPILYILLPRILICGRLTTLVLHSPALHIHGLCQTTSQIPSLTKEGEYTQILHLGLGPLTLPVDYYQHDITKSLERAYTMDLPTCSYVIALRTYPSWPSGTRRRMRDREQIQVKVRYSLDQLTSRPVGMSKYSQQRHLPNQLRRANPRPICRSSEHRITVKQQLQLWFQNAHFPTIPHSS